MTDRLEIGDRVRSNDGFDPVPHEGKVHGILVGYTRQGPVPILRVLVDKQNGKEVPTHLHESAASLWDKVLDDGSVEEKPEKPSRGEVCPSCGEIHSPSPFTPEMISLFQELQNAPPADRSEILLEMADFFMREVDETDQEFPDWVHAMVEKAENAQRKTHRAMLRIGRMVARNIEEMQQHKAVQGHIRKVMIMPLQAEGPRRKKEGLN